MQGRTMDALNFTVSPVIHNQPIRMEVDQARQRDLRRWFLLIAVLVGAALFDGWQRHGITSQGFQREAIRRAIAKEEDNARHLQLEIAFLRSPARIEEALATYRLNLVQPAHGDFIEIQRVVPPVPPPSSVVASR
jgi:hypothetical protein